MINKWIVNEQLGKRKGCIIALPGRSIPGEMMERFCQFMGLPNTLVVVLEPHDLQWYPQPLGPDNQKAAVDGLKSAISELHKRISIVQRAFHLRRNQIALMGFSAGAVMAVQMVANSNKPFAASVCLAGAVLEPDQMPEAPNQTPTLLRHAIDDDCFKWDERYLPMKQSLLDRNYNVYVSEKPDGGHGITVEDARVCGQFISSYLGYKKEMVYDEE